MPPASSAGGRVLSTRGLDAKKRGPMTWPALHRLFDEGAGGSLVDRYLLQGWDGLVAGVGQADVRERAEEWHVRVLVDAVADGVVR
jgi:hypothetical protein